MTHFNQIIYIYIYTIDNNDDDLIESNKYPLCIFIENTNNFIVIHTLNSYFIAKPLKCHCLLCGLHDCTMKCTTICTSRVHRLGVPAAMALFANKIAILSKSTNIRSSIELPLKNINAD